MITSTTTLKRLWFQKTSFQNPKNPCGCNEIDVEEEGLPNLPTAIVQSTKEFQFECYSNVYSIR